MTTKGNAVQEEIRRVAIRIKTPERWTIGAYARTKRGYVIGFNSHAATSWCLAGACRAEHALDAELEIERVIRCGIPGFNDDPRTTHADVMRVLHKAFLAAGKEQS